MLKTRLSFLLSMLMLFLVANAIPASATTARDPFPVHDSMRANVAFWKKVYGQYPTTNGLIHDNRDLSIIYEVIDLEPRDSNGASKRNSARMEEAKAKYKNILLSLAAAGGRAHSTEEKRVLALFGARPSAERLRNAAEGVRFQLCLKDHFAEGVVRSGAYLGEIKRIIRSYGLPVELAYLPHVESSFNYKAYSKAGAAGMWQFTRDTGKRFMNIDYTLDERRDPIRATHAAAQFLKGNYEKLGSWPLALTAYNHGTAGMMRAKNAMGSYQKIFDHYDGSRFGFASRNFYSEFIAAVEVAKNYKKHFGDIKLDKPVSFYEVTMSNYAPVRELSRHFKVDLATLRELNPALRPPVFEGRKHVPKGYRLRLPDKNGTVASRDAAPPLPKEILVEKQQPSRFYRVRKGDTAGTVAKKLGVKLEDLVAANDLNSSKTIVVGQNLRIPGSEEKIVPLARKTAVAAQPTELTAKPLKVAATKETGIKPKITVTEDDFPLIQAAATKKAVSPPKKVDGAGEPDNGEVPAAATETVLAEEAEQLERQAALARLPQGTLDAAEVNPRVVTGNLQVEEIRKKNGRPVGGVISIEAGETIGHLAGWLNVPARTVLRWNGLRTADSIKLGQRLKIAFDKVSPEDFEERRYEFHKEIEEDFFAVYKIDGARLYRIKPGDNIWRLCSEEFDLPAWLVRKYNTSHDLNNLKLDDQLIIPVVRKVEEG